MRLRYFESSNFGDALNPYIFSQVLPGFFDEDPAIDFFGIGSILGFDMVSQAKRKVIFTSGFAYGTKPLIDDSYDIICVRGPLTADALKIDQSLAVIDGAALLRYIPQAKSKKEYKFSFMPHWESELKFDWRTVCEKLNIHYLSPTQDFQVTIDQMLKSEVVIAEAMHAAIVADALRVPWIPVKSYPGINDFKWRDWATSLDLPYIPHNIPSLFSNTEFVRNLCQKKISSIIPQAVYGLALNGYSIYQALSIFPNALEKLESIKNERQYLSEEKLLITKSERLMELLEYVKHKY